MNPRFRHHPAGGARPSAAAAGVVFNHHRAVAWLGAVLWLAWAVVAGTAGAQSEPEAGSARQGSEGIGEAAPIFAVDFEADDWQRGLRGTEGGDLRIMQPGDEGFEPLAGRALRVTVAEGSHTGSVVSVRLADHLPEEPERLYFRYHLRLADHWQTPHGGKLPGFAGTYGRMGWGGRPSDGSEGWSLRGMFFSARDRDRRLAREREAGGAVGEEAAGAVAVGTYAYHAEMTGTYGDHWAWDHDGWLQPGRWHLIEQELVINHPDRADGVFAVWVDGRRVYHSDQVRLRTNDRLRIQTVWMNVYYGGREPAPRELHLDIDNLVVGHRRPEEG